MKKNFYLSRAGKNKQRKFVGFLSFIVILLMMAFLIIPSFANETSLGFSLNDNNKNIESITLAYKDDDGNWITLNDGDTAVADAIYRLTVQYKDIGIAGLIDDYNKTITFDVPDLFRNGKGEGNIMSGSTIVGDLEIKDGKACLTFDEAYLNTQLDNGNTSLSGDFYITANIDLGKLPSSGSTTLTIADKTYTLNFGDDPIAKYGDITIEKTCASAKTITINDEEYLLYTIKVTAGEDGCVDVSVVDEFTANKDLVSYVNIDEHELTLATSENMLFPYETKADDKNSGFVYLANKTSEGIPESGVTIAKPGVLVWKIGDMDKNESRILTYYVKLENGVALNGKEIKNVAGVYSKGYKRTSDTASFTPTIKYDMKKITTSNQKDSVSGDYIITYKLSFISNEALSNFPLRDFKFFDYLNHPSNQTNNTVLEYVNYDLDSFNLYVKRAGESAYSLVDKDEYVISFSKDRVNYKSDWQDSDGNPLCFNVSGGGNEFVINPGDSYYLTYSVKVNADVLARMQADNVTIKNRWIAYATNATTSNNGGFDAFNNNNVVGSYTWDKKSGGVKINEDQTITLSDDKYTLDGNEDVSGNQSFVVPSGSYRYYVEVNKTFGDFDVGELSMKDELDSNNMQYVGYLRIDALEYDGTYNVKQTKWVKIDGLNTFNISPKDIGWIDNTYAYAFTYYAKPVNQDTYGKTSITNRFSLNGKVVRNGNEYLIDNINSQTSITITGNYNMNVSKKAWYYLEPDSGWSKGRMYWVVEVSGSAIKEGTVFRDSLVNDTSSKTSYFHADSLVGIYKGSLSKDSITDYQDLNEALQDGLVSVIDKFDDVRLSGGSGNNYQVLDVVAKENIALGDNNKIYIVVASEPSVLPLNYRDVYIFKNKISTNDDGVNFIDGNTATKNLCGGGDILKELGQVFKFDGTTITNLQAGKDGGNTSKIVKNALIGSGTYVSWAIKVNYAGDLTGKYQILEKVPEDMELAYVRIKWVGTSQRTITSYEIDNLDGWTKKTITATSDNVGNITTTYYVKDNQALISLGDFKAGQEADVYSVDVQIVCRLKDPKVLLGNEEKTYTNNAELISEDGQKINEAFSPVTLKTSNISKSFVVNENEKHKIDFTIEANTLGQELPSNYANLKLVDKLSDTLILDTTTIKVVNSRSGEDVNYKASLKENNTLEIEIPNKIPVKITYTALVNAMPGQHVSFSNEAYWQGYDPTDDSKASEGDFYYTAGGSVSTGTNVKLRIIKKNQNDLSSLLTDASFRMVACLRNDDGTFVEDTSNIWLGNTDENGELIFGKGTDEDKIMKYNTVYKISETSAPTGYVLDTSPIYIMVPKMELGQSDYSEYVKKCINDSNIVKQYQDVFELIVYNHKGEISVTKEFKDALNEPRKPIVGTYYFALFDNKEANGQPIDRVSITYSQGDVDYKSVKFTDLDLNSTYYVFELDEDGNVIKDLSKTYFINDKEYLVSTDQEDGVTSGTNVTITNTVFTRMLPETGGNKDLYIKTGLLFIVIGIIAVKWREK